MLLYLTPRDPNVGAGLLAKALPSISMLRTGDVISQIGELLGRIAIAIRSAAAVTVVAGTVVLIGAVTASSQARRYDTVILKLLGGSRAQLLGGQAIEYGLLAVILAAAALLIGTAGGMYVVRQVLELRASPDPLAVAITLLIAIAATLGIGVLSSLPALRARPAAALRSD